MSAPSRLNDAEANRGVPARRLTTYRAPDPQWNIGGGGGNSIPLQTFSTSASLSRDAARSGGGARREPPNEETLLRLSSLPCLNAPPARPQYTGLCQSTFTLLQEIDELFSGREVP